MLVLLARMSAAVTIKFLVQILRISRFAVLLEINLNKYFPSPRTLLPLNVLAKILTES